ncbi:MAG: hypothetical protein WC152_06470 [Candidatus Izemoplasmatales bacterium]
MSVIIFTDRYGDNVYINIDSISHFKSDGNDNTIVFLNSYQENGQNYLIVKHSPSYVLSSIKSVQDLNVKKD